MKQNHIIFLHGWGGSKQSLAKLAQQFEPLVQVHLLEMPGHGETPPMNTPWEMHDFVIWLKKYIKDNDIETYTLVGHSFGGKIILESLTSQLLRPKQIVLINTSGIKPKLNIVKKTVKQFAGIVSPLFNIKIMQPIRSFFYRFILRERDYVQTKSSMRESFKLFIEQHYDDKLSKITTPTIIIWAKNDTYTPLWMGEKIHKGIQNSIFFVCEGTHGLPIHKPKIIAEIIIRKLIL